MQLGKKYLLKCTECDKHVIRPTLSSGNTFGAILWTDGRLEAPMLPRRYDLPYWCCPDCGTFHNTADLTPVDERYPLHPPGEGPIYDLWESSHEMQEPGWRQYLKGIRQWEKKLEPYPDWETELRMLSWRRYNDRFRNKLKKQAKRSAEEQTLIEVPRVPEMIENANDAANWLYEGNPDKGLDKADLLRWLGRFELALQLLNIVRERKEFDPDIHSDRHSLLVKLSRNRDPRLGIVRMARG